MLSNRWLLLGSLLPLTACSSAAPGMDPPAGDPKPHVAGGEGHQCRPDTLDALVGKTASEEVIAKAVRDAGARNARVVKPGMAVTMDFREDRLTIRVDEANKIEGASCG